MSSNYYCKQKRDLDQRAQIYNRGDMPDWGRGPATPTLVSPNLQPRDSNS